mmetsp:Transcript_47819/g.95066  ORF Transcript_47819/g.95066 Transcript_47819/m.95066 type:complete len:390 (-) Transcript_47819:63-1232(-)
MGAGHAAATIASETASDRSSESSSSGSSCSSRSNRSCCSASSKGCHVPPAAQQQPARKTRAVKRASSKRERNSERSSIGGRSSRSSVSTASSYLHAERHGPKKSSLWGCCGSSLEQGSKEYVGRSDTRARRPVEYSDRATKTRSHGKRRHGAARRRCRNDERGLGSDRGSGSELACAPAVAKIAALEHVPHKERGSRRSSPRSSASQFEDDDDGAGSVRSDFSVRTAIVAQQHQGPPEDASALKAKLREFVRVLVKGKELRLLPTGAAGESSQGGPTDFRLTRAVDALLLLLPGAKASERVVLTDILQIHRGLEAVPLELACSLDASTVVLELVGGRCLSFATEDAGAAEELSLCLRLLTAMHRQKLRGNKQQQQQQQPGWELDTLRPP